MDRTVGGLVFPLPSSKASEYTSTLSLEDIRRHQHYMCGGGERKKDALHSIYQGHFTKTDETDRQPCELRGRKAKANQLHPGRLSFFPKE